MDYNYLFIWVGIFAFIASSTTTGYFTDENGYEQYKTGKMFAIVTFIPIIYFIVTSTSRYWTDYGGYLASYSSFPTDFTEALATINGYEDSNFFYAFTYLIKVFSGGNVFAYRLALALLQLLPIIYMLRKYSVNFMFSVYMFVVSAIPLAWMLNGVRQLCAAAIIYGATQLFLDKKYVKTVILILFATMFHQSAIMVLPMVFICQGKAWNRKTLLCILGAIVFVTFFSGLSSSYETVMSNAGYDMSIYAGDDGVHPLRVLVNFVPAVLAFMGRDIVKDEDSPIIHFCTNMSLLTFGIYLVAMVTSGILVGRVPLYTSMYSFILLPYLIDRMFYGGTRRMMYFATVGLYFVYYWVQYA